MAGEKKHKRAILVINSGSTSLKLSLFTPTNKDQLHTDPDWSAGIHWKDDGVAELTIDGNRQPQYDSRLPQGSHQEYTKGVLAKLWQDSEAPLASPEDIAIVGHRIVHGGPKHSCAQLIDEQTLADIKAASELAPLHQKSGIEGIEIASSILPGARQAAVFDTAYFHDLPCETSIYAIPYRFYEQDIRRYGFHGISHHYCAQRLVELIGEPQRQLRILSCHLGGGASITASLNTKAFATTMGFTPLEGLVMGTRSGSIDPGLILHLLSRSGYSVSELSDVLNHSSGMKGLSGRSGDIRELLEAADQGDRRSRLALDVFVWSVASHIGSLLPAIDGADVVAFTGGIGENSPVIRAAICKRLNFLHVDIDAEANAVRASDVQISTQNSGVKIYSVRCREDLAIARECQRLRDS